ncbi:MAG: phenylacetate-CoA oxygenase subunit PaaI, partial [Candidatus Marinimicrobia bacterium]|nr:phenylacetate-CoA oxygenase subunit PaaI [Candidatus Neomarinimicrobiota bacterium]
GYTNDELRQIWMKKVVPLCEGIGIKVPAHYNEESDRYDLEYDFPLQYDPNGKRWLFDEHITWEQVFDRWRGRGPYNERFVEMIQGDKNSPFAGINWLS